MNCIEFHELCWVACTAQCELQWYHSYNLEWLLLLHWFKQRFFTHIGPATYIFANIKLSQGPRLPCSVLLYLLLKLPQHHQSSACVHLHGHRSSWVSQFQVIKPWFQFTHHWSSSTAFVAKAMMNKHEGQLWLWFTRVLEIITDLGEPKQGPRLTSRSKWVGKPD